MKRLILPTLSAFVWFGCSGSQPGPGAEEDKLSTEAAFCAEWAKAVCSEDAVLACNGTRSGCLTTQQAACRVLVPPGYQSDHAEDCLEAVEDAYADAELTAEELEVVLKLGGDCSRLNDGGQEEGDDCVANVDCDGVNGFECVIRPGDSSGTCQIPVEVAPGGRCSTPEAVCPADVYCNGTNCVVRSLEGETCAGDMCEPGLRCALATGDTETTCIPMLGIGDPCSADADCASNVCIGSTDTDKICVSSIILTVRDPLCRDLR
jgi:hypothetical protein